MINFKNYRLLKRLAKYRKMKWKIYILKLRNFYLKSNFIMFLRNNVRIVYAIIEHEYSKERDDENNEYLYNINLKVIHHSC